MFCSTQYNSFGLYHAMEICPAYPFFMALQASLNVIQNYYIIFLRLESNATFYCINAIKSNDSANIYIAS